MNPSKHIGAVLVATFLLASGCGVSSESLSTQKSSRDQAPTGGTAAGLPPNGDAGLIGRDAIVDPDDMVREFRGAPAANEAPAVAEGPKKQPREEANAGAHGAAPAEIARQIIYTATVHLVVKDIEETRRALTQAVNQFGGYVSDSDLGVRTGSGRTGRWVVRIPVPNYARFLDSLEGIGVPESVQQKASDVTQEFIDLTARIANQRRLEDRLAKLLEDRAGELKDAIEVERELARVRSEIEVMEGRLRYLKNQTSLSTVSIFAREEVNYIPPQAPTFSGRISAIWFDSLRALRRFGEVVVLAAVAITPWSIVLAIVLGPILWLARRQKAAVKARSADR